MFRRRRHSYTTLDLFIFLGILLLAVIYEKPANMWLYISIIVVTVACTIYIEKSKLKEQETTFSNYTKNVPTEFVKDHNTLGNIHCVAKYFPAVSKIVVMDHPDSRTKTELRSFEITKENIGDVNKAWNDICSVFDQYTFFDTLFSYIDKNSGVLKVNYIHRTKPKHTDNETVEEIKDHPQPEPVYKAEALVISEYGDPLINIEQLDKTKSDSDAPQHEDYNEFVEMDEILKSEGGKIDVNIANTDKLSTLPGINIVKAKKIIEYRDKNGFFKSKEDFCKIAGVKEHFKSQIEDMITVDKSSKIIVENPRKINERIVD